MCARLFLSFVERDFFKLRYFLPPPPGSVGFMSAGCLCQSHGRSPEVQGFFLPHAAIHCRRSAINNAQKAKRFFLCRFGARATEILVCAASPGLRLELLIAKFVHLTLCSWMLTLCFYQLANNGCSCVCRPLEGT